MDEQLRILIVDDNDDLRELYALWLGEHDVETADGGIEGLEQIHDGIDLVLLDREMPGPEGREVAIEIHDQGYNCHVAMVSSLPADFDIVDYPIDWYLQKPLGERDLLDLVQQYNSQQHYQTALTDFFELSAKLAAIEAGRSEEELAESETYDQLRDRIERKRVEVDEAIEEMDPDWNMAFKSAERMVDRDVTYRKSTEPVESVD